MTHEGVTRDWFRALNKAFNFNVRTRQQPLHSKNPPDLSQVTFSNENEPTVGYADPSMGGEPPYED